MSNYILYGGSFNPIHEGHVNVIEEVLAKYKDHKLILLPSYQSPLKEFDYDPGIEHRIGLVKKVFENNNRVIVEEYEFRRKEQCFTIDVLPIMFEKYQIENLKFVIGTDQLLQFHKWKNYDKILQLTDLIVVSRPGYNFLELEELNAGMIEQVKSFEDERYLLKSGKEISSLELNNNYDISSSQIRAHLRKGKDMRGHLPEVAMPYFDENNLYKPIKFKVESYEDFTKDCFTILKDKNALGILAYDVRNISQPSDFNLIASGTNVRQTSSLSEHLIRTIRKKYALSPVAVEGLKEGRWVVIDYGLLIVHVFYDFIRSEYKLEELWSKGVLLQSEE